MANTVPDRDQSSTPRHADIDVRRREATIKEATIRMRVREADLREREIALAEKSLDFEIRKFEHHVASEAKMQDSLASLRQMIGTDDDEDAPIARNSRGRA